MAVASRIFVSYARRDDAFARALVEGLRARGVSPWFDQFDIPPGTPWDRAVEAALDASEQVLILLSTASVVSENVLDEITLALDEGKQLIPLLVEPCRAPLRLRRKQHIDFTGDHEAAMDALVARLAGEAGDPVISKRAGDGAGDASTLRSASIAMLPLRLLSHDDDSALIAGGLHDEVTTGLSRIAEFHVVSASTTRAMKDSEQSRRALGHELGVRYLLTGSLAKSGDRLRVAVSLAETQSQQVLWDERFDVEILDLFEVIDRITRSIVGRLHPRVFTAEIRRIGRKSPDQMTAWELVHRARIVRWSKRGQEESVTLLRRALELDPDSAIGHAELARALSVVAQWSGRPDLFGEVTEHARRAIKIAPDDPGALVASCVAYCNFGRFEEGHAAGVRALEVNPNSADAWACTGFALSGLGRPLEGIEHIGRAMELSPKDPLLYVWHLFMAHARTIAGDRRAAVAENAEALRLFPSNFAAHMTQAISLAVVGEQEVARLHWAEAQRLFPPTSPELYLAFASMQRHPAQLMEIDRAAMEAAGLTGLDESA